jgi:dTDP-4-dehydrorhamnose reductase
MILLLGASGFIGQAFASELQRRKVSFQPVSRASLDYTRFDQLLEFLRSSKASFVINASGHTGRPNVDASEEQKAETLHGNTVTPVTVVHACLAAGVPWAHVSSGCIYSGAKVLQDGEWKIERDLNTTALRERFRKEPAAFRGFDETDPPNFSFRQPPCSFYSASKALAEEALGPLPNGYLWRLRIPFDEQDNPRNYLTKLLSYPRVYDNINSLSHRADFARACVELWQTGAPFGIYNVTNPGAVSTREVIGEINAHLFPGRTFEFWDSDEEFYRLGAKTPRSNCILDTTKLTAAGVSMPPVKDAIRAALSQWSGRSK